MSDGIYVALSGAIAQQRSLDTVANNVANAGTHGFRADRVTFAQTLSRAGAGPAPPSLSYVEAAQTITDPSDGALEVTGNPLDLAIRGDGFFAVQGPNGERFTRDGNFAVDAQGGLRTQAGLPVLGADGQPVVLPQGTIDLTVGPTGILSSQGQEIGAIRVARFANVASLTKEGDALFIASEPALPAENANVVQGAVESANVNAVSGMNELIEAHRAFDAFQRVIQAYKQVDERTARELAASG